MNTKKEPRSDYDIEILEKKLEQQEQLTNFLLHVIANRDKGVPKEEFKNDKKNKSRFDRAINGFGWSYIGEKIETIIEVISGYFG